VRTRIFYWILNLARGQCKESRTDVILDLLEVFVSQLAAAVWTICKLFREALLRQVKRELQLSGRDEIKAWTIICIYARGTTDLILAIFLG